jgi:hypothetical protein
MCKDPTYRAQLHDLLPLTGTEGDGQVTYRLCLVCTRGEDLVFHKRDHKDDHSAKVDLSDTFNGLFLITDFLSEDGEAALVEAIDNDPSWKES